ncbi:unnamed protein product [Pylaiella littoralis]
MGSYSLPFESPKSWHDKWINGQGRCTQGNHTDDTHKGDLGYAFDFKLRPGTKACVGSSCRRGGGVQRPFRRGRDASEPAAKGKFRGSAACRRHLLSLRAPHAQRCAGAARAVAAGDAIALSGSTGFTSGPHLHFDVVNTLPQETSELWVVHPAVLPLLSIAAIFSGPLNHEGRDFTTAPLVYLSPETLLGFRYSASNGSSSSSGGGGDPQFQAVAAPLIPLLACHPEVVVLIDRGGAGGEQTFTEAAATAVAAVAAVAAMPLSASHGFFGGGGGGGGAGGRRCRCVGVIVANNRPDHEVFPMAALTTNDNGERTGRAPFPVVMISRESGQLLKCTLLTSMDGSCEGSQLPASLGDGHAGQGHGGVIVSLGAAEHCPTPAARAVTTSAFACGSDSGASPAASGVSTASFEEEEEEEQEGEQEEGDVEGEDFGDVERLLLATMMAAAGDDYRDGVGVVEHPFSHISGNNQQPLGGIWQPPPWDYYLRNLRWSSAVPPELRESRPWYAGIDVEEGTWGGGERRNEGVGVEDTTREWKREKMLYRAKTLPVAFNRSIW